MQRAADDRAGQEPFSAGETATAAATRTATGAATKAATTTRRTGLSGVSVANMHMVCDSLLFEYFAAILVNLTHASVAEEHSDGRESETVLHNN